MNAPAGKIFVRETPEQNEKFANTVKSIRTALEHIKVSQLLLEVQFGTLNMYFQTGL